MLPFQHPAPCLVLARGVAAGGSVDRAAGFGLGRSEGAAAIEVYVVLRVDGVASYALGAIDAGERPGGRLAKGEGGKGC